MFAVLRIDPNIFKKLALKTGNPMKTKTLISSFLITLIITIPSFSQTDLTREAIQFTLSTFNPALSQQEYQHQVQGILNRVLHDIYVEDFTQIYNNQELSQFEQQLGIMTTIAETSDVTFIVLRDGSTYWTDSVRGQRFDFRSMPREGLISGTVHGERMSLTLDELKANVFSIEFSYSNPNRATITRKDGVRFLMDDVSIGHSVRGFAGGYSSTSINYLYRNPVTGSEQTIRIWDFGNQREDRNFIRLIVFGLERPKMNPVTEEHFPPDYTFDPYDGSVLVPVPYQAPWRP